MRGSVEAEEPRPGPEVEQLEAGAGGEAGAELGEGLLVPAHTVPLEVQPGEYSTVQYSTVQCSTWRGRGRRAGGLRAPPRSRPSCCYRPGAALAHSDSA